MNGNHGRKIRQGLHTVLWRYLIACSWHFSTQDSKGTCITTVPTFPNKDNKKSNAYSVIKTRLEKWTATMAGGSAMVCIKPQYWIVMKILMIVVRCKLQPPWNLGALNRASSETTYFYPTEQIARRGAKGRGEARKVRVRESCRLQLPSVTSLLELELDELT